MSVCRPDTQMIFVDIGYGFHVEFTWDEALNYIPLREQLLARSNLLPFSLPELLLEQSYNLLFTKLNLALQADRRVHWQNCPD